MGNVLLITGSPKTGKSHIGEKLSRFPGAVRPLFYTTRLQKTDEVEGVDAIFKSNQEFVEMKKAPSEWVFMSTRHNEVALSISALDSITRSEKASGFLIVSPDYAVQMAMHGALNANPKVITIFMSPLSGTTVQRLLLKGGQNMVKRHIRNWFMEREVYLAKEHGQKQAKPDTKYVSLLTDQTMEALRLAHLFDWVIPSPEWSGHKNWKDTPVAGDASETLGAVLALLKGQEPKLAEKWPKEPPMI